MKLADVNRAAILAVLPKMGPTFQTKELSEHPDVWRAHPMAGIGNYHAMIGKALAQMSEVEPLDGKGRKGARWKNLRSSSGTPARSEHASQPAASLSVPEPTPATPSAGDLGPQYARDGAFKQRMRLHQSWYRANVLGVPYGRGEGTEAVYGNMLTEADGAAGKNFLTPQIHDVARRRLAQPRGLVNEYRLLHNMLSSQPMCFNLFAPLATDLELGTRLVRAAWGQHIARVTRVELEWAPTPEKAYLDDRTSFDAFIEYQRHDGALGFIGIETKLTEPFSETHVDKPTYRRWMTHDSPWHPDRDGFDRIEHNQLWRDHLLAWAMLRHPQSRYAEGRFTLLYHPEDQRCRKVVEGYRRLLQDQSSLDSWTLDQLVPLWKSVLGNGSWLDDFAVRYLDLHLSHASTAKRNSVSPKPAGPTVRRGHWAALEQLELPDAYAQTRAMYREILGTDVYLRPTDSGFTVLSLDSTTCDSMIGVGSRGGNEHSLRRLPPERHQVEAACAGYHDKRSSLKRASAEERYALRLIQAALSNGLGVPRPNTYFVTQEWRLPSGKKLDLLCVDPLGRRLVVVELKADEATARSSGAAEARQYAEEIHQHRAELYPFFQRLARTLARHHHAPALLHNLELDPNLPPQSAVSWPGSAFHG